VFRFARTIGCALTLALGAAAIATPPASATDHPALRQVLRRLTTGDGALYSYSLELRLLRIFI
jgi:hypothetical protein